MTREEILAMPAGREMDVLITEKITQASDVFNSIKPYSTSIAHAWEVVEKFRADKVEVNIASSPKEWECLIGSTAGYSETVPLAICRAALLAVTE